METEEQARARITAEVSADPSFQGLIATDPDLLAQLNFAWMLGVVVAPRPIRNAAHMTG
jgi:hypothetical protein